MTRYRVWFSRLPLRLHTSAAAALLAADYHSWLFANIFFIFLLFKRQFDALCNGW